MTYNSPIWRDADLDAEDEDELDLDPAWDDQRRPALTLAPAQQAALFAAVEAGLQAEGCDNTLRAARQWAEGAGVAWSPLQGQLEGNGGYCDCEVLLNVAPAEEPDEPPPG